MGKAPCHLVPWVHMRIGGETAPGKGGRNEGRRNGGEGTREMSLTSGHAPGDWCPLGSSLQI